MGTWMVTILAAPPYCTTVLTKHGGSLQFGALFRDETWHTIPKESPMPPPLLWWDTAADAASEAEEKKVVELVSAPKGQLRFDF